MNQPTFSKTAASPLVDFKIRLIKTRMKKVYTYQVINTEETYSVYTNTILLGKLKHSIAGSKLAYIETKDKKLVLRRNGIINPLISITDKNNGSLVGSVKISSFGRLFPKVTLTYNRRSVSWIVKSFFSLHWQWKKNGTLMIETLDNIEVNKHSGVIVIHEYNEDAELLIMIGLYLNNITGNLMLHKLRIGKSRGVEKNGLIQQLK